jgi:hypothetical protein
VEYTSVICPLRTEMERAMELSTVTIKQPE